MALLLPGCAGGESTSAEPTAAARQLAADCDAVVRRLLAIGQGYLDSIDTSRATDPTTGSAADEQPADDADADVAERSEEFRRALTDLRAYAGQSGCDPERFQDRFSQGLAALATGGPVARAVQQQLVADAAGRRAPTGELASGDDLASAVAATASGGTVRLQAGTFELADALVLLRGVTITGAGRDATTLVSAAGDAVLVLTGEPVALRGMTVRTGGDDPGSVVTGGPGAEVTIDEVRISGGVSSETGEGAGVLMAEGPGGQEGPRRRTTLRMTDSELTGNGGAGLLASGEQRVELDRVTASDNGLCGLCFVGRSDGTVQETTVTGSPAGVLIGGAARPVLRTTTVTGGEVGVQVLGTAAPELDRVTVAGSSRAGVVWGDTATGVARGTTCRDVPFPLVVGPDAAPTVEGDGCPVARGQ